MLGRHRQSPRSRGLPAQPSPKSPTQSAVGPVAIGVVAEDAAARTPSARRAAEDAARRAAVTRKRATATQRRERKTPAVAARVPERKGTVARLGVADLHPLTDAEANQRLFDYESRVKASFDCILPVLRQVASMQCEPAFVERATALIRAELGFDLPAGEIEHAWIRGLDMRRLFAMAVFRTYRKLSDAFYAEDPLGGRETGEFETFLHDCGFHLLDVTPCADGRLAHAISYVLRLPYDGVRRKSYAGSLFDIEDTVQKWAETELQRFREGRPTPAEAPTRYLKTVIYHFSSGDPSHQGCAAHGSDDARAARAGLERLQDFQQAIENTYCCGASVDLLLIGLDTDTDAIRVHVPDDDSQIDLDQYLDARKIYAITRGLAAAEARAHVLELVRTHALERTRVSGARSPADGMLRLIARLLENNLSQIDYVRQYHQGSYADVGHAERFIGTGIGFEEIQLRNLTYFAYLSTVEEGEADVDVGIRIFNGLNVSRGLPIPVVVRHDYHGRVPGARERAVAHCERIARALQARFPRLVADGLLHCLRAVRDCDGAAPIEIVGCSLLDAPGTGH